MMMKFRVNDGCIGCGLCASTCPNVFHLNDEGLSEAAETPVEPQDEADALAAMEGCPVQVIEKVED